MRSILIISLGDTRSWMKLWVDQINTHLPVRIHYLSGEEFLNHFPNHYDRYIFIGKSIFFTRENLTRLCALSGINPLRVFPYPEENLPFSVDDTNFDQWSSFVHQVILSSEPENQVEAVKLEPIKKVAILGSSIDESITEVFHQKGLETFIPSSPLTIKRHGIQYLVESPNGKEIVGGVVIIPEFQPIFSYSIPNEVDETRKVLFLKEFQSKVLSRSFQKETVVFLVPEVIVPVDTWSTCYDLSQVLVERDQCQVFILCREAIVAGDGLEKKYRSCRKSGVLIEKIDFSKLILQPTLDMRGSWVDFTTERDGISQRFSSDWVVKVPGEKVRPSDLSSILVSDRLVSPMVRNENINLPLYSLPLDGLNSQTIPQH